MSWQSIDTTPAAPNVVLQQPSPTTFPSAANAQNFQYMNHPPPVPGQFGEVDGRGSG
ncbi:hypothetical protein [Paraburkholderia sp. UCT31]|uniref:hypothetical protein n=1 Tax=Paraburkholderia sp. UCT31 TaxID=2615209 RepID=UPI001655A32F|nr:hypothetical protein [Paraburkholderia sp. UCT31]